MKHIKFIINLVISSYLMWISQAVANEKYILSFIITDAEITGVLIRQGEFNKQIIYQNVLPNTENALLAFDSPSLDFYYSSVNYFYSWIDLMVKDNQQIFTEVISHQLQVHIATNRIESLDLPFDFNYSPYLEERFRQPFNQHCFNKEYNQNKKHFFSCLFTTKIQHELHINDDNISFVIESNEKLMSSIARLHFQQHSAAFTQNIQTDPSLINLNWQYDKIGIMYWSTSMHPYLYDFKNDKVDQLQDLRTETGGSYQIGSLFRQDYVLPIIELEEMKKISKKYPDHRATDVKKFIESKTTKDNDAVLHIMTHQLLLKSLEEITNDGLICDPLNAFTWLQNNQGINLFGKMILTSNPKNVKSIDCLVEKAMQEVIIKVVDLYFSYNNCNSDIATFQSFPLYFIGDMLMPFKDYYSNYICPTFKSFVLSFANHFLNTHSVQLFNTYKEKFDDYATFTMYLQQYVIPWLQTAIFIEDNDFLQLLPEVITLRYL